MKTLKNLNIYTEGKNRIIKIPEFARYVGLTKEKFENDNFDYAFSKKTNSLVFIDDFDDFDESDKAYCPVCGQEVSTKRGTKNKHSFTHYPNESCRGIESDEISEEVLNSVEANNSTSSNHSELPKLQKFRYKISGQGLVNLLMQIQFQKQTQGNTENIIIQDSIKPILELSEKVNVETIDNLDEFIKDLSNILYDIDNNINNLETFLNSRSDEELSAGGLNPKTLTNIALNWGLK